MNGYFIDEISYNLLVQMATVNNDTNSLDVLETATPMVIP